ESKQFLGQVPGDYVCPPLDVTKISSPRNLTIMESVRERFLGQVPGDYVCPPNIMGVHQFFVLVQAKNWLPGNFALFCQEKSDTPIDKCKTMDAYSRSLSRIKNLTTLPAKVQNLVQRLQKIYKPQCDKLTRIWRTYNKSKKTLNVALSSSAVVIRSKTGPSSSDAASLTTGSSSAAWLESSSSSSNPLYFESSVDASSISLGAASLLGASPLLHGLDDDEFEVDADISPISSETRSSDTLTRSTISRRWKLAACLDVSFSSHLSSPSRFGIIRVGDGVRRLSWIEKADWEYLQASTNYHKHPISLSAQQFFNDLLQTDSLVEYVACVNRVRSQGPLDPQIGESVFHPSSAFHTPRAQESVLGSLLIHTVFRLLANKSDRGVIYLPGEILLSASSARRAVRRNLGPEDEKPLGLKVDGFWQSPGTSDYEIGMLEISVGHLTNDLPRYLKDRVRGFWGMRDLLDYITGKLSKGDISIMRKLHVWFIYVYGHEIQVWSMDLPASRIYHMTCIGKISLSINWDNYHQLLHGLSILWNFGREIESSITTLENLCKSN
ncbi:hypothetical protein BC936DRAFT_137662, partial [Jimgerdemannia flammicorona]